MQHTVRWTVLSDIFHSYSFFRFILTFNGTLSLKMQSLPTSKIFPEILVMSQKCKVNSYIVNSRFLPGFWPFGNVAKLERMLIKIQNSDDYY